MIFDTIDEAIKAFEKMNAAEFKIWSDGEGKWYIATEKQH